MASVVDAPLIVIVENNTYSELTPIASMVRDPELYRRAAPYGIPASRIDGNDLARSAPPERQFTASHFSFVRIEEWRWDEAPTRVPIFSGDLPRQDHPLPKALDDAAATKLLRAPR